MSSVAFRLTIYEADGTTPDLTMTSIRSGTNPYIVGVPSGDGQEVDLLTGTVRSGAYNIEVADVVTGSDGTGTVRLVTSQLEDNKFRQQLLSRRAKLEMSRNNGSTWSVWILGYLTGLRQVDAITYGFTVSDSRRIESTHTAFTWSADANATTDERREFPNRGCLIGGPTLQNFGPLRSSGGWEYLWKEVQGSYLALSFVAAYNAPSFSRNPTMNVIAFFNALRPFFQSLPPVANLTGTNFEQIRERQYVFGFPAIMAIVTSGSSVWYGTVRAAHTPPAPGQNGQGALALPAFGEMNYLYVELDPGQSTSYPSADAPVRVQLLQKEVSSASPLYINEHPVDIVSKLYETVNIPFSASSATTTKALVGDDVRLALRVTEPVNMGQFLAQSIFGPFGFSARTNASGEQEFFATRIANSATPSITITDDDVVGDNPPPVFEVDEASVVTSFRLTAKSLSPFVPDPTGSLQAPPDGLVEVETSQVVQNGDTSTFSTREVTYRFPGMVHDGSVAAAAFTLSPEVVGRFFTGIVAEGFDRFGRGAIASEVQVLSGASAASLQVGDEVLLGIGYYPNKNYRIGESSVGNRIAQIVRRTEAPEGPIFKLIDSGVSAQPTAPTFTLAAFAGDPRREVAVTVTNAATLNTAQVTLAVQYQVSASSPTKTGTLYTRFRPGTIPTVAFTLPKVAPGSTVWVRMRTERTEYRASAWTNWTSQALNAWIPPASLTVGTKTANSVALSWSLGSPTANTIDPLDVFAYKGASAPADWTGYRIGALANGSTSIIVRDLDPSTQYTFGVAFKDEVSGAYSTFATATTTTNAVNTVQAPNAPKMKVYTSFPDAGTTTGVALAIGAVEGYNIVVQRAADSSGSPGAWKEIALLAPLTPIFVDPLPSDGLTRWYRVFYRLSGFLDGTPGTARSATPIAIPDDLVGQNASIISGGATLTFGSYLVGTPDSFYDGATSQSLAVDATSAATANKVVARDNTGSFSANTVTATLNGPAPAGQLTGDTLAANVITSSLTSVGTIGSGTWQGTSVGKNYGGTGLTSSAFSGITNERVFAYDGVSGAFFVAPSGSNGQALVYTGGALAWGNPAPGPHVLATTTGLGTDHTVSGLTSGMILQATGATTARFQTPSIPASSVTAGTFSGASYTITNDLTVSGTLTGTLTGNASTATALQTARNINGVSFNGTADITVTAAAGTLTGSTLASGVTASSLTSVGTLTNLTVTNTITGSVSGNAGNVTGTVAIANGGTNATSYGTSGTGTRAIVYDIGSNAFEAVAAGTSGQFLQSAGTTGDITWATPPNFSTTTTTAGYVPGSNNVGATYFLNANGAWAVPAVGSVSANNVTAGTFSGANYYFTNNVRFDSGARVAFGYGYTIDNAGGSPLSVLTATTLGSGVINSSLTSVGTLTSGALGAGFTAIDNARLANSSITINGTSVSLGGSITVPQSQWVTSGSNIYYSAGNVAIGTSSPSASIELLVRGAGTTASTYGFFTENSSATATFWVNDAGNVSIPNGNLGIGTSPTANRLAVNGVATVSGSLAVGQSSAPATTVELVASTPILTLTPSTYSGSYRTTLGTRAGAQGYLIFGNNSTNEIRAGRTGAGGFLDFFTNNTVGQESDSDGVRVMRLTADGKIGIGTTSPSYRLVVSNGGAVGGEFDAGGTILAGGFGIQAYNRSTSAYVPLGLYGSSINLGATTTVNGYVIFKDSVNTNTYGIRGLSGIITADGGAQYPTGWNFQYGGSSNSALYINSSGNVGIGTTSPSSKVHLYSTSAPWYATVLAEGSVGRFAVKDIDDVYVGSIDIQNYITFNLSAGTDASYGAITERMRITAGGNVLIGTTTDPTTGGFTNTRTLIKQIADGGTGGGLHIEQNSNTNVAYFGFTGSSFRIGTSYRSTGSYQPIDFYTGPTTASSMILSTSGNLGIGTSSPTQKLEVAGVIRSHSGVQLFDTVTNAGGFYPYKIVAGGSDYSPTLFAETGLNLYFTTGGSATIKAMISAAGNVGIGTTSPGNFSGLSFGSPILDVTGSINIRGTAGNGVSALQMGGDTYRKAVIYTPVGTDTPYLAFGVATSGSASTASEFVRITSGGNVGIGTTAPGARLDVAGGDVLINGAGWNGSRLCVTESSGSTAEINGTSNTAAQSPLYVWNNVESGSTYFISFYSDGQNNARTLRGYINYRRDNATLNLTTASDYRIKTIHGRYTKSGEVFDKLQIHEGTINGETGRFPMAVAHELQEAYAPAVEGEKDAVNEDGSPKLQMVSYVAMIPVMLAEIKSLRERVAQLEMMS